MGKPAPWSQVPEEGFPGKALCAVHPCPDVHHQGVHKPLYCGFHPGEQPPLLSTIMVRLSSVIYTLAQGHLPGSLLKPQRAQLRTGGDVLEAGMSWGRGKGTHSSRITIWSPFWKLRSSR